MYYLLVKFGGFLVLTQNALIPTLYLNCPQSSSGSDNFHISWYSSSQNIKSPSLTKRFWSSVNLRLWKCTVIDLLRSFPHFVFLVSWSSKSTKTLTLIGGRYTFVIDSLYKGWKLVLSTSTGIFIIRFYISERNYYWIRCIIYWWNLEDFLF